MKTEAITSEFIESIVVDLIKEGINRQFSRPIIISTDDIADVMWKKYRIPTRRDCEKIRKKIKHWWSQKEKHREPKVHWFVGQYAVFTTAPMKAVYCTLPTGGGLPQGLIFLHPNQSFFKHRRRTI